MSKSVEIVELMNCEKVPLTAEVIEKDFAGTFDYVMVFKLDENGEQVGTTKDICYAMQRAGIFETTLTNFQ